MFPDVIRYFDGYFSPLGVFVCSMVSMIPNVPLNRNHFYNVNTTIVSWIRLNEVAYETKQTIYSVKHGLLSEYLCTQIKSLTIHMELT